MRNAPDVDIRGDDLENALDGMTKDRREAWARRVNAELGAEPAPWHKGETNRKTEVEKALEMLADVEVSEQTRRWSEERRRDEEMLRLLAEGTDEERKRARSYLDRRSDEINRGSERERQESHRTKAGDGTQPEPASTRCDAPSVPRRLLDGLIIGVRTVGGLLAKRLSETGNNAGSASGDDGKQ